MKNIEHCRKSLDNDNVMFRSDDMACEIAYILKYKKRCNECSGCEFYKDLKKCLDYLLEEHREPIKLTQFEYDMLIIRKNAVCYYSPLKSNTYFKELKEKGYFKNVDLDMTAKEVLENCEVE